MQVREGQPTRMWPSSERSQPETQPSPFLPAAYFMSLTCTVVYLMAGCRVCSIGAWNGTVIRPLCISLHCDDHCSFPSIPGKVTIRSRVIRATCCVMVIHSFQVPRPPKWSNPLFHQRRNSNIKAGVMKCIYITARILLSLLKRVIQWLFQMPFCKKLLVFVRCPVTGRDLKSGDNTESSFMMVQIAGTMASLPVLMSQIIDIPFRKTRDT